MAKFIELTSVSDKRLHYLNPNYIVKLEYPSQDADAKTVVYYNVINKLEVLFVEEELESILKELK